MNGGNCIRCGQPLNTTGHVCQYVFTQAQVALCPNCHGQKTVSKPPHIAGDQTEWATSDPFQKYDCPTCDAKGYLLV